ncbi:MAG: VWA domain-containing protein [Rhodospirillales bacterium]|nr:VWA domain-containing protein [Rhodospirillales bacterium]
MADKKLPTASPRNEVTAFLTKVATLPAVKAGAPRGRLLFALDATASREPAWDHACRIQGEMFRETTALGGLDIQLSWYRGFGEFETDSWVRDAETLSRRMSKVSCRGGETQIEKVLRHALTETRRQRIHAVVFVGDCMEEDVDLLCHLAGELGVLGVPLFLFHEGEDEVAARAFREMARLSGGACCRFDPGSPRQLRDLLAAVAVYAVGGRKALEDFSRRQGGMVPQLTHQIRGA